MRFVSLFLISVCNCTLIFSQNVIRCSTEEVRQFIINNNPSVRTQIEAEEKKINDYLNNAQNFSFKRQVITIPVVIHVIHDGDPIGTSENISDAQILSQIEVLNKDYRKLNSDTSNTPAVFKPLAADIEIEFCLAQRDPDGNPTTGIIRHNLGQATFTDQDMYNQVMPQTMWNRNKYLNIYTVRLGGSTQDLLGFSAVPGYPAGYDGVVIGFRYFGNTGNVQSPYNKGRTATHEIGHWLGLQHTWGIFGGCNDDDNISDTPESDQPYYGCPAYPKSSCGSEDMFMNFMDYVNDACMSLFTQGQKTRMLAVINTSRNSLLTSDGCSAVPINQLDVALVNILYPQNNACENPLTPVIEVKNVGSQTINSLFIQYQVNGGNLQQYQWSGNIQFSQTVYITMPPVSFSNGANNLFIQLANPNSGTDNNLSNNEKSTSFIIGNTVNSLTVPFQEDYESGQFPPIGWAIQNINNDRTWELSPYGSFGTSFQCMYFDNFSGTSGNNPGNKKDALITLPFNFSGNTAAQLSFDIAYARRNSITSDTLIVYASIDCGLTWNKIYAKGGNELSTSSNVATAFVPNDSTWRTDTVSLSVYANYPSVQFKFENKSGWGNNLYVDNLNIFYGPSGIEKLSDSFNFKIYPNPNSGSFSITIDNLNPHNVVDLQCFDIAGKSIFREEIKQSGQFQKQYHFSDLNKGIYIIRLEDKESVSFKKVVVK
jgi:hypothetical protein